MKVERSFRVPADAETVRARLADEATLTGLFPDARTEVTARAPGRITVKSRYKALGREGEARFHFSWDESGDLAFEKVCDGNVWKQLRGAVVASADGASTRVRIAMEGRTKAFVPEITIKVPMEMQMDEMVGALRDRLSDDGGR